MDQKLCGVHRNGQIPPRETPLEELCGKPAIGVVKAKAGILHQFSEDGKGMGRGVGSLWIPVCIQHRNSFPDHEGFDL